MSNIDYSLKGIPTSSISSHRFGNSATNREIKDLVDIVGSKRAKEIYFDNHFVSPQAFKKWQENPKYPTREEKYSAGWDDLDEDRIKEFIIKYHGDDGTDVPVAVNGYRLRPSKFPLKFYFSEAYPTKEKRKGHNPKEWLNEHLGITEYVDSLKRDLDPAKVKKSELYSYIQRHPQFWTIKNKFAPTIPPYRHFVSYTFKTLFNYVKQTKVDAIFNTLPKSIQNNLANVKDKYDYFTFAKPEIITICASACWNKFIIQPILNNEDIKEYIKSKIKELKSQEKEKVAQDTNYIVRTNEEIQKKAIQSTKGKKWFKENVIRIYSSIIEDSDKLKNFSSSILAELIKILENADIKLSMNKYAKLVESQFRQKHPNILALEAPLKDVKSKRNQLLQLTNDNNQKQLVPISKGKSQALQIRNKSTSTQKSKQPALLYESSEDEDDQDSDNEIVEVDDE